jgi:alanine dehydrogenase
MNVGILKESRESERRVALTPAGVQTLITAGARVYLQHEAGLRTLYSDEEYQDAGAQIAYTTEEVVNRCDVVMKVAPPSEAELGLFENGQALFSFLHLIMSNQKTLDMMLTKKVTGVAYELIENMRGELSILQVMSEIAGHQALYLGAHYLQSKEGGRGVLMGSIPGVPPTSIVILGAGTVGRTAAKAAIGLGANVTVLDKDLSRLRDLHDLMPFGINTVVATSYNIAKAVRFADVVIGAVLLKGEKAPHVVTEAMVKQMKPGSVILDISIDQGGCIETSRPTTMDDPVFVRDGVVHYCVPNMTTAVPRTASMALTNGVIPYLLEIHEIGLAGALASTTGLAHGVCTYAGACTNAAVAKAFGMKAKSLAQLLTPVHSTQRN